jgi:hypothetical protein
VLVAAKQVARLSRVKGGWLIRRVVASSFFSFIIGGGLGGGATQRWKLRYRKNLLSSQEKKEFVGQTSSTRQSTRRTCTDHASAKLIIISITLKQSSGQNMNTLIKEIN